MRLRDLVERVADVCERIEVPYYITGSVASSFYGESRLTQDVDVVIELPSWKVREFCEAFPPDEWYVDAEAAMEAVRFSRMFNVLHPSSGLKIDVMGVKDSPFDESRLGRARRVGTYASRPIMFAAPEDVILKKLDFYREGGSDKHLRDITSMFKVSGGDFDLAYTERWALRIGVQSEWRMIKERLGIVYPPPDGPQNS
ncbi:MAG TPA: hypothetical protein PKE29_11285 [Phycisphaerales bacterium]|nr:hypothetical protein [Phycisphaerales bacterium]